ncbi:MAG: glycosyltransferase [bacterium]
MNQVSIIIITYNRLDFFKKCLNSVLKTTTGVGKEILIWDNGSSDGTKDYINEVSGKFHFIKSLFSKENIGVNAKALSFEAALGDYIVCIDDDVLELPAGWIEKMIDAFNIESKLGYLALDVIQNEHTTGAKMNDREYTEKKYSNGITLQFGPVGGWCFMVPRKVYEIVGKLRQVKGKIFFGEDGDYIIRCRLKGYKSAILKDIKCFHATGKYYNENYTLIFENKMKDFSSKVIDSHTIKLKSKQLLNKIKKIGKRNKGED